ncbi:MAG: prepilin-type N-terminal cleavage/methylation domain-containing protein [Tepidisphaeraceae bacterium]
MTRSSPPAREQRQGFTLVELLVVIGIIALLIAILMPALSGVRRNSQKLACSAKLRTLGQVLVLHANEHQGYMPLAGNITPGKTTNGPDDPASLGDPSQKKYVYYENTPGVIVATALPAALSPFLAGKPSRGDSWQNVNADMQADGPLQNAFICPSDENTINRTYGAPRWINNYGTGTFLNGWSSFGINAEVFAWTDNGVGGTTGHSRLRGKLAAIPMPSQTMLMCDTYQAIEVWVLGPQLSLADVYLGTGGTVGSQVFDLKRHRGEMNILFADGHVDSRRILATGKTTVSGDIGSPDNSPSGELAEVSMDKGFR